jgi:hypothetical protein
MKMTIGFIALSLITMLVPILIGCTETQYEPEGSTVTTEKLQILSHSMTTNEYGNIVVKGTAKNISSSNFSYAEIKVKFYDASGALLDTWLDNINDLGPGETWSFEVMYLGLDTEKVKSYQIGVGTIF